MWSRAFVRQFEGSRGGRQRASELPFVMCGVAELALAHDDPTQEAVSGVLLREGNAAEDLQRSMGDLARRAGDIGLCDRRGLYGVRCVVVERGSGVQNRRPRARLSHVQVREKMAERLVAADRVAELLALAGIGDSPVKQL